MTKQEMIDAAHEALNGLSIGWMMANVKDSAKRAELQAPISAGRNAMLALLAHLDPDEPGEPQWPSFTDLGSSPGH